MDPDKLKAAIEAIKTGDGDAALAILEALLTGAAGDGTEPAPSDASPEGGDAPPPSSAAAAAGRAVLMRLTGCATEAEALTQYQGMQNQVAALAKTQEEIELNTRRGLIVELIKIGIETPALAWLGKTDEERTKRMPCARLMAEPIEEMSARIKTLSASRPRLPTPPERRPEGVDGEPRPLRAPELAECKRLGITEDEFNRRKSAAVRRV